MRLPVLALVLSLSLAAQPAPLFQQGKAAFEAGRLAEALQLFEQARASDPSPELLLNIAQCHRGLGRRTQAIATLEAFLAAAPNHPLRRAVENTLNDLRAEVAKTPDAPVVTKPPELTPPPKAPEPEVVAPPTEPRRWPYVVGGVAVGAAVIAGVVTAVVLTRPKGGDGALPELATLRIPAP